MFIRKIIAFIMSTIMIISNGLSGLTVRSDSMKIIASEKYQKMVSWGTSGCWWSQQVTDGRAADEIARLLYDDETGLGLNVYRFNIGAGERENPQTRISIENRKSESFYYCNETEGKFVYDFTRDAASVKMMDKALAAGADSIIMFCNSPHYSMTASGQASGGLEPAVSNLPRENYQAFVDYVLTIADHFVAEGYPVTYISPINEPQWDWGGENVSQEGCHYTAKEAVELLELFAQTMQERNTPYGLMGIESGELSPDYYEYIDLFAESKILTSFCNTFCAHSYWIDNDINKKIKAGTRVRTLMPGMDFEMSEWCELPCKLDSRTVDSALYMAAVIAEDLRYLGVNSWSSWTACGVSNNLNAQFSDRFFEVRPDFSDFSIYKRYYAFKHFSHFIPEGSVRIKTIDSMENEDVISVAYERPDGKTALVIVNSSNENHRIKLDGYVIKALYITDETHNCEKITGINNHTLLLNGKSIVTAILEEN